MADWISGSAGGQPGQNAIGGIGSLLSGLFGLFGGHGPNPATGAANSIGQIPGQTKQYYQPYMDAGQKSLQELMSRYGQDAGDVYKHFGEGFKESPGYQYNLQQAMNAAKNSAASGGSLGTPYSQQFAEEQAHGLASQDYNDYMKNVLGIYNNQNAGLGDINQMGYGASGDFAKMLAEALGTQAQYQYAGQGLENQNKYGDWQQIFNSIPGLAKLFGGFI